MGKQPSEQQKAIFRRRHAGATMPSIAAEFGITVDMVRLALARVERYERGVALLRDDPCSLEGLGLAGRVPGHARRALAARGFTRITELAGIPKAEILKWPNVGRKSAVALLALLEECLKKPWR